MLNALFDFATEGIIVTNKQGEIVLVNPHGAKQFGYEKNELIGKRVEELIPQRFAKGHIKHRETFYKDPLPRPMGIGRDLFARRKDGSEFPVEISLSTFINNNELFILAFIIDITERKKISDDLQREKEQAQQYLEIAPLIFLVFNADGTLQLINKNGCELFGFKEEDVLGKTLNDITTNIIPNSEEAFVLEHLAGTAVKQDIYDYESPLFNKKEGTQRIILWKSRPINDDQTKPTAYLFCGEDITERKEHEKAIERANYDLKRYAKEIRLLNEDLEKKVEERTEEVIENQKIYSAIARNFPNGMIAVLDKNLHYVFVEGKELYELGLSRENMIGGRIFEYTDPSKTEEAEQKIQNVLKGARVSFEMPIGKFHFVLNAVPLTDLRGDVAQVLIVMENITEEKEAKEALMHSLEKEKELGELKSKFVSMASHEFRTPLSTILSSVSLIDKYKDPSQEDKRIKHINRIKSSVQNLTQILNDFLSLGKLEEGKVESKQVEFNLVEFSEELVQEMQAVAKDGQKINFKVSGKPAIVKMDDNSLRNILNNLLSNAIKYSPPGKSIEYELDFNHEFVNITVKDNGIGIPDSEKVHLFERFFRASNANDTSGTGLGLSIVKRYLELMHGTITCDSVLNEGTTFIIHLPLNNNQ